MIPDLRLESLDQRADKRALSASGISRHRDNSGQTEFFLDFVPFPDFRQDCFPQESIAERLMFGNPAQTSIISPAVVGDDSQGYFFQKMVIVVFGE